MYHTFNLLSKDLQLIYGSQKFYTLPHQYDKSVFDLSTTSQVRKAKSISISYHGGLQFGRNIDILIDAYVD
jgi:hypothetical protein